MVDSSTLAEIRRAINVLHKPGTVFEVRIPKAGGAGTVAGWFDDPQKATQAVTRWDAKANIYITLNPVNPALLARASNRLKEKADSLTQDVDIVRRRWLLIDSDPVRPAGISATNDEKKLAEKRAQEIRAWLTARGWPPPVVADSGNGWHLLYHVHLPNDDETRDLIKHCLEALAYRFDDDRVAVDTSVYNAARVVKLYGTLAVKGDSTKERPHRRSYLVEVPDKLEPVPVAKLEELAALAPRPQTDPRTTIATGGNFDLQEFIARHGLHVSKTKNWHGATLYELETCPFNPDHRRTARIIEFGNGALAFGCFHNSCQGYDWHALRRLLEPGSSKVVPLPSRRSGRAADLGKIQIESEEKQKESQADALVRLGSAAILFHDDEREPFAVIPVGGHREIWPVRSRYFKRWLVGRYFEETGKAPNADAVNQALNVLEAAAVFKGEQHRLNLRVAEKDGAFWYDLADPAWHAVRITADRWEVVDDPPILFRRHQNTGRQVMPERGGDLQELLDLVNVGSKDDEILLLVYTVTALVPEIPKPILDIYGEKGAGKTTLLRILRALIDPAVEPLLVLRNDDRELALQLAHNYAPFFDNLSLLTQWQSDMLCRAATGAGLTVRALYTDDEEKIFRFKRAVGVNGIHLLTGGTDLQDRFLTVELERIDKTKRRQEQEILTEFERMRPRLFGAMLDALSAAMRIKPSLNFSELPRMADFAAWGAAVAEALGFGADRFLGAYWRNIGAVSERILQSHPVAAAVVALLDQNPVWEGTPAELLERLERVAEKEKINTRAKTWPKSPNSLSKRLKELASNFADAGIALETGRNSSVHRKRYIRLQRLAKEPSEPSEASEALKTLAFSSDDSEGLPSETVREPSEEKARRGAGLDDLDGSDDILLLPLEEADNLEEVVI